MASRKSSKDGRLSRDDSNKELFLALDMFENEKGIPKAYMIEKISTAITTAAKKNEGYINMNVVIDPDTNKFEVSVSKTVVDEITDRPNQLLLEEAYRYDPIARVGDTVSVQLDSRDFGRIIANSAKHVIRQGIRELERSQVTQELQSRNQEIVTATVERIDQRSGAATIKIGKLEMPLTKGEQVPGEVLHEGDIIKVFVVEIKDKDKNPRAIVSRTHPGLVKRLFENEVPEIFDGAVEIKAVSREAGSRTKLAVWSNDPNVDALGSCIGHHRSRVNDIVNELGGEKIDIIEYSEDPAVFISNALSPASVTGVEIDDEQARTCRVTVPASQLSLAIGNKGQNARLAARLTGWKIDIRSDEDPAPEPEAAQDEDAVSQTEDAAPETDGDDGE